MIGNPAQNTHVPLAQRVVSAIDLASGSGTTGDPYTGWRTAVQTLLNAGGRVYMPAGVWSLDDTLTITGKEATLIGDGPQTQLKWASVETDRPMLAVRTTDPDETSNAVMPIRWTLANFQLNGNGVAEDGILLRHAHRGLLESL